MTNPEALLPESAEAAESAVTLHEVVVEPLTALSAGLRDAQLVADRVRADEAAADAERARLASEPLHPLADGIEPDLRLAPDEIVHAVRRAAILEQRAAGELAGGTLYLTSDRLVHIGEHMRETDLRTITEVAVSLERLLLVHLADGSDLAIEVDQPRLLRVQIAAARAAAKERAR
jgi:hypothetical protein